MLQGRLADAVQLQQDAEERHHAKLKEVARRCRTAPSGAFGGQSCCSQRARSLCSAALPGLSSATLWSGARSSMHVDRHKWTWLRAFLFLSHRACNRLKEEHLAKVGPLQQANARLMAELSGHQQDASQLSAVREQLAASSARADAEAGARAELSQRCAGLEAELADAHDRLATATKSLRRAEQQLGERQQWRRHCAAAGAHCVRVMRACF